MPNDEGKPKNFWEDFPAREEMREKLGRYLDLPLALASVVVALLVVIQLTGEVGQRWEGGIEALSWAVWGLFFLEFAAKFALAPVKRRYLRENWLDVLILSLPFLRLLRALRILRATRSLPVFRLLVLGGRGSGSTLALLTAGFVRDGLARHGFQVSGFGLQQKPRRRRRRPAIGKRESMRPASNLSEASVRSAFAET